MFISVVMPTYNRADVLARTLSLYAQQTGLIGGFQIVVVDDASGDDTQDRLSEAAATHPYELLSLRLPTNSGPGAARNRALDAARGDLIVFVGDDMLPAPNFLARHHDWHAQAHPDPGDAMVGHIDWAPELAPTALLRWLERSGTQFSYGDMQDGTQVGPDRFYASNVSLKRAMLQKTGQRFDERLRFCEDSEFGARMSQRGMRLWYHASAHVDHLHPTNLRSSLRRMNALGEAAAVMEGVAPETFARITSGLYQRPKSLRSRVIRALLSDPVAAWTYDPLARLFERRIVVDRIFALAHAAAFRRGLDHARKAAAS